MSLKTEFDKLKFDTRMLDINLNSKKINQSDINSHLSSLEDSSSNSTHVSIDEKPEAPVSEAPEVAQNTTQNTSYGQFDPNNPLG